MWADIFRFHSMLRMHCKKKRNRLTIKKKRLFRYILLQQGKRPENGGMFYTAQSGIWQTVWMEKVPSITSERLKITPLYDQSSVIIQLEDAAGKNRSTMIMNGKNEMAVKNCRQEDYVRREFL